MYPLELQLSPNLCWRLQCAYAALQAMWKANYIRAVDPAVRFFNHVNERYETI